MITSTANAQVKELIRLMKKSRARVGRLKGTLFYRERMALPPQVVVHVQLYPQHSSTPVAVSIMPAIPLVAISSLTSGAPASRAVPP